MEYEKILKLSDDKTVQLGQSFKAELGRSLALGMTAYVCKNGTLSDGHEKLTPAQRYYQAIKEMWYIANSIVEQRTLAMEAQADLLEGEEELGAASTEARRLRAEAKILRAKNRLTQHLVNIEDSTRCLKAFDEVRRELKNEVERQYPEGIEQAEPDNWKAVAKYRGLKRALGYQENLTHVPLPMMEKARLGVEIGAPDLFAWLAVAEEGAISQLAGGDIKKFLAVCANQIKLLEEHRKKREQESAGGGR